MELFKYLLTDMKQPISYIPQGILTGVVAVMVMYLVWKRAMAAWPEHMQEIKMPAWQL